MQRQVKTGRDEEDKRSQGRDNAGVVLEVKNKQGVKGEKRERLTVRKRKCDVGEV